MQNSPLVHISLYKATVKDPNNQENRKNSDYDNYMSCWFQFSIVVVKLYTC